MPPVDGIRPVAGEAVEAEEGTGFLFTMSGLGTVIFGRVVGGVGSGGSEEEMSRREGRPRFIILLHFSFLISQAGDLELSAVFDGEPPNAAVRSPLHFDHKKEALRPLRANCRSWFSWFELPKDGSRKSYHPFRQGRKPEKRGEICSSAHIRSRYRSIYFCLSLTRMDGREDFQFKSHQISLF